jgi:molybdenum cofactor cytidylyltransferase
VHRGRAGDRGRAGGDGLSGRARIGAVVLAAGGSRRLGRPKQLVAFRGEPLVRRAARAAIGAGLDPVVIVIAPGAVAVHAAVADLAVEVVENERAATGMASSVQEGVAAVLARSPGAAGVALLACDQPLLDAAHLRALLEAHRSGRRPIVASEYGGVRGVPAILDAGILAEVVGLTGDAGAREIVRRDPSRVVAVPFPGGELDVDRAEDLDAARRRERDG